MLSKSDHFYQLQNEGNINENWFLNSHDFSIWNVKSGKKLKLSVWINRSNWNKDMNY